MDSDGMTGVRHHGAACANSLLAYQILYSRMTRAMPSRFATVVVSAMKMVGADDRGVRNGARVGMFVDLARGTPNHLAVCE